MAIPVGGAASIPVGNGRDGGRRGVKRPGVGQRKRSIPLSKQFHGDARGSWGQQRLRFAEQQLPVGLVVGETLSTRKVSRVALALARSPVCSGNPPDRAGERVRRAHGIALCRVLLRRGIAAAHEPGDFKSTTPEPGRPRRSSSGHSSGSHLGHRDGWALTSARPSEDPLGFSVAAGGGAQPEMGLDRIRIAVQSRFSCQALMAVWNTSSRSSFSAAFSPSHQAAREAFQYASTVCVDTIIAAPL